MILSGNDHLKWFQAALLINEQHTAVELIGWLQESPIPVQIFFANRDATVEKLIVGEVRLTAGTQHWVVRFKNPKDFLIFKLAWAGTPGIQIFHNPFE